MRFIRVLLYKVFRVLRDILIIPPLSPKVKREGSFPFDKTPGDVLYCYYTMYVR